ncbi:MAG: PAS domain S-box protein [Dehalococcoidales bacterium]|nr:PAS domain S-box protein [Dehalococcoidales bacterium]
MKKYIKNPGDTMETELLREIAGALRHQTASHYDNDIDDLQLVNNANDLIQSINSEGRIVWANQKWLDTLGYRKEGLPFLNISDIIPADKLQHCLRLLNRVVKGEKLEFVETVFKTRDGREINVEGNISGFVKGRHFIATLGVFRDVTQRKAMERANDLIIQHSPTPIYVVQDGVFRMVNPSFVDMTGYSQEELLGKNSLDYVHPQDRQFVQRSAIRMLKAQRPSTYEFRIIRKDGEVRWVTETVISIMYAGSRATLGTMVDFTERRLVEVALQESRNRYQTIFNSVADAIYIVDTGNRFLEINDAACKLWGYPRQEFFKLNSNVRATESLLYRSGHEQDVIPAGFQVTETEIITREGKHIPVESSSQYIEYEKKKAILTVVRDISERKQVENIRKRNQSRLESLVKIAQYKAEHTRDLLYFVLEEMVKLTGSRIGLLYLYSSENHEFSMVSWSKELISKQLSINRKGRLKLEQAGLLGNVVKQGKPLIVNQNQSPSPTLNGYPEGRYRLDRSLFIPVFRHQEIAAVVSVANKDEDYDQPDVQQLTLIIDSAWNILERWRAEEAQHESEQRYRQLIELSQDAILRMDMKGTIVMANPAAQKMFGYSEQELIGLAFEKTYLPEEQKKAVERLKRINAKEKMYFERQALRKDGSIIYVEASISPLTQGYFQEVIRDITERKRVEEQIKYQAMLIDHVSDAIISTDLESKIVSWNHGAEKIFGWRQDEVTGKNLSEILRPDTSTGEIEELVKLILKKGWQEMELVQRKRDGTAVNILASTSQVKDERGQVIGLITVSRDITGRKKMENALAESEKKYKLLVENQTDVMAEIDTRGVLLFVNPAYCRLLGKKKEELLGTNVNRYIHEEDLSRAKRELQLVFIPPYTVMSESRVLTLKGWRWISWTDNAVLDDRGNVVGVTCLGRDITESKLAKEELERANEQLREVDRLKDNFLSTVSHELRTPLTSIKSFTEILLNYDEDKETQKEFLGIINEESDRLTRLINDFLDLSKIQAGRMQWRIEEISVEEAILTAAGSTRPLIDKAGLELITNIEPDLPRIMGDKDRLIQVITNILGNAVKFTPENGKITIRSWLDKDNVKEKEQWVTVSITDTGIGIAPENHQKIFERFGQVGDVLKDRPRGTGLGLPICKRIVEQFGGSIWLQSDLGKGTTFFFTVPVAQNKLKQADYRLQG